MFQIPIKLKQSYKITKTELVDHTSDFIKADSVYLLSNLRFAFNIQYSNMPDENLHLRYVAPSNSADHCAG